MRWVASVNARVLAVPERLSSVASPDMHSSTPPFTPSVGAHAPAPSGVSVPTFPGRGVTMRASWADVRLSSVWTEDEGLVLREFFTLCVVDVDSVSTIVGYAEGSSKAAAEKVAAAAGDSGAASNYLAKEIDRNVQWLKEAKGDIAVLGKRVRQALQVPDISANSRYLVPPVTAEEHRDVDLLRAFVSSGVDLTFDPGYVPTSVSGNFSSSSQFVSTGTSCSSIVAGRLSKERTRRCSAFS